MADYKAIRKSYEEDEELNASLSKKLETNNTLYDNQKATLTDTYNKQIEDSKADYEDAYRENAVQKKINEFYIKEDMANMGLSDSGLSRSQITANQLSYSNQKADIDRQRQSMVDSLTREMTTMLADLENERMSKEQGIRDTDAQYRDSLAASQYNTEVEAETEQTKAYYDYLTESTKTLADANAKAIDTKDNEYKSLYTHLNESGIEDYDYSAQMIDTYLQKYDIDPDTSVGRAELNALLKAAGITYEQFLYYADKGTIYVPVSEYNPKNPQGITKFNYKTDGKANYKIEVVNDTWNWFGGVDGNATVNIYYPNGTKLASKVKLNTLSKDVAKKITELTKGSGNEGKVEYLKLDLSKEDLG